MEQMTAYLRATAAIDCDNATIKEKARVLVGDQKDVRQKARSLFYFVRDGIKYNLYLPSDRPEYFRASRVLEAGEGFCIQKAVLLAALARAAGIPARLHIAAIRNHRAAPEIKKLMGGDVFPTHGYNGLYIDGRWIKAAPTFNLELCRKNSLVPVEFDGEHDAVLPPYDVEGRPYIEYVEDRGYYDDLPFEKIIAWRVEALGADFFVRVERAIESRKARGAVSGKAE